MDAMAVAIHIKYALSLNRHLITYFQCSCLISLENKRWFSNCFLLCSARALHLLRRCRLVSYSSPQRGHIGSSAIFSKLKCRLSELCPVRRPIRIFKSFRDSLTAYFAYRRLLFCRSCLACRQFWMSFHLLLCSWTDHLVSEASNVWKILLQQSQRFCFEKTLGGLAWRGMAVIKLANETETESSSSRSYTLTWLISFVVGSFLTLCLEHYILLTVLRDWWCYVWIMQWYVHDSVIIS